MAQGKARNKQETIEALEPYFTLGYSVTKACSMAGIPQSTFQTWIDKDENLRLKVTAMQGKVSAKAREVLVKSINNGNEDSAKWWLERRERESFSTRHDITSGDKPITPILGGTSLNALPTDDSSQKNSEAQ